MPCHQASRPRRQSSIPVLLALVLAAPLAVAQPIPGEYGDAPEDNMAYPSLGVVGHFPTCIDPLGQYVAHGPAMLAWFGQQFDTEIDGNAGQCNFAPYDLDECGGGPLDLDAGLEIATAYTIDPAGQVVSECTPGLAPHIGDACEFVSWGSSIDIWINNDSGSECVVNVLIDWNRDGRWAGGMDCPNIGMADEHVVQNLPVPIGFHGPIAALNPPDILTGPDRGYFWARFTIVGDFDAPLPPWDGSGEFEFGETEDYLLSVGESEFYGELGDAPQGVVAYPSLGV